MSKQCYLLLNSFIIISSVLTLDFCTTLQSHQDCLQNSECEWVQTLEKSCQQPIECHELTEEQCQKNNSYCNWNNLQMENCTLKQDYCKKNDENQCNDQINCSLNSGSPQNCEPKGKGFGCKLYKSQYECTQECKWVDAYCEVESKSCMLQKEQCTDENNCIYQINKCEVKSDAEKICLELTDQKVCIDYGCNYDDGKCSAPDSCSKPAPGEKCNQICDEKEGVCHTKEGTCKLDTIVDCQNVPNCNWNTNSICQDDPKFCKTFEDCDKKFCKQNAEQPSQCVALEQNDCIFFTEKESCESLNHCQYNQAKEPYCSYIQTSCQDFGLENYCNTQAGCKWLKVSVCKTSSKTIFSQILKSHLLMVLIIYFLI